MSDTASTQRPSSSGAADPWWGGELDHGGGRPAGRAPQPAPTRQRRPLLRRRGSGVGWLLLGLLVAPLDLLGRLVRRSPRLRRMLLRLAVVAVILALLASSVGVILINNFVIGRTAELGELEDRRRELRRDNAVLGAQAARLEAPDIVYRRATRDLGMVRTEDVPEFVYLFDGSRALTSRQRQQIAARRSAAAQARAARAAAASAQTPVAQDGG
jgi:hypothetical protein